MLCKYECDRERELELSHASPKKSLTFFEFQEWSTSRVSWSIRIGITNPIRDRWDRMKMKSEEIAGIRSEKKKKKKGRNDSQYSEERDSCSE